MPGGIIYLDIDDEITSAAARVRSSEARRVAIVLPYGSRVATSRINFRLLSRDALINEKQLAVIAGDPATRALAASAGLPVFGSVAEYESSFDEPAVETESPGESEAPDAPTTLAGTAAVAPIFEAPAAAAPSPPGPSVAPVEPAVPARPVDQTRADPTLPRPTPLPPSGPSGPESAMPWPGRRRASRLPMVIALALAGLVVLAGGVAAYVLLPSANIVVTPQPEPVAAVEITVTADPAATEPNAATNVVPAVQVPIDVTVTDTFPSSGKRVEEAKATGRVRFSNLDFLRTNTVLAGSVISTNAGVRFRTSSTVTVPRADLVGLTVFPGRATVGITAVDAGTAANVEPNTIVIVPKGKDPQALKVVNPDATTGGTHDEFPKVVQADIDAALKSLATALDAQFQTRLGDPSIVPPGATVFRETATLGKPNPTVDPKTLVNQEVASFDLGVDATGSVIAVDPTPVSTIAEQKVRSAVTPGHELVAGSIHVTVGKATVNGQIVTFPATATAQQIAILDANSLRSRVLGKSLADARAILGPYGAVKLGTWPDWVGSIPTIESRVSLTIGEGVPVETPGPTDTPS